MAENIQDKPRDSYSKEIKKFSRKTDPMTRACQRVTGANWKELSAAKAEMIWVKKKAEKHFIKYWPVHLKFTQVIKNRENLWSCHSQ